MRVTAEATQPGRASDEKVVVLLVDDQAMVGEAVRRALAEESDIEFHYCAQGATALEQAKALRPSVILQDLVLPDIDGLTLVQAYRADVALQNTPIIVLSTREEAATKSAAFGHGANDYLVKLPDRIELVARIRYHSRLFFVMRQRDEAYRALRESQKQLVETNLALRRLTQSDGLTGLANRRYFDEYLETEWARGMQEHRELSVLMIDVDHFKTFNDTYGHVAGDDALQRVAQAMRDTCNRPSDLVARYGGEEFAAILPSTSPGGARLIAEKLRIAVLALGIAHSASTTASTITVSVGCATVVPEADQASAYILGLADQRLYDAKRAGRNRVQG